VESSWFVVWSPSRVLSWCKLGLRLGASWTFSTSLQQHRQDVLSEAAGPSLCLSQLDLISLAKFAHQMNHKKSSRFD